MPEKGKLQTPEQLVGKNVCTSFVALTEEYFRKLEAKAGGEITNGVNGDSKAQKLQTNIKYVGGSVEAACALGVADGIVDLVGMYTPCHSIMEHPSMLRTITNAQYENTY